MDARAHYKVPGGFQEKFRTPVFEVCDLIKSSTSNVLVREILKVFKDSLGDKIHE